MTNEIFNYLLKKYGKLISGVGTVDGTDSSVFDIDFNFFGIYERHRIESRTRINEGKFNLDEMCSSLPDLDYFINEIIKRSDFRGIEKFSLMRKAHPPTDSILQITTLDDTNNIIFPVVYTYVRMSPISLSSFSVFVTEDHKIIHPKDVYSWMWVTLDREQVMKALFN